MTKAKILNIGGFFYRWKRPDNVTEYGGGENWVFDCNNETPGISIVDDGEGISILRAGYTIEELNAIAREKILEGKLPK